MILVLGVALAGAIGAPLRYVVDGLVQDRVGGVFPWGTFVVNITGSFVLGVVTGLALWHGLGKVPKTLLGSGFCGSYTTFSTFSYETVRLLEDGAVAEGLLNAAAGLVIGLAAAGCGLAIAAV